MPKQYRLMTEYGSISDKLFTFEKAKSEVDGVNYSIVAVVTPRSHKVVYRKG